MATHVILAEDMSILGYTDYPEGDYGAGICYKLPAGYTEKDKDALVLQDGTLVLDLAGALARAKEVRRMRIKLEAASLIKALDWRLERAREREAAGWGTLTDVNAVLAEREAIRRSSDAAEARLDALTDFQSVQTFTWSVDVSVPIPAR